MIKKYSTIFSYNSLVRIAHFDFAVNSIFSDYLSCSDLDLPSISVSSQFFTQLTCSLVVSDRSNSRDPK